VIGAHLHNRVRRRFLRRRKAATVEENAVDVEADFIARFDFAGREEAHDGRPFPQQQELRVVHGLTVAIRVRAVCSIPDTRTAFDQVLAFRIVKAGAAQTERLAARVVTT
jgi:hypothetical protein